MAEENRWEERYRKNELPWDTGCPDTYLVRLVSRWPVHRGAVLDVGCGTGTNTIWLAEQGFDALGLDLAREAVSQAEKRAAEKGVECRFLCADFLTAALDPQSQHFVFDRGCFHSMDEKQRPRFVEKVAELLLPDGLWLSMIGNQDDPVKEGPPKLSARQIAEAVEPCFEILSLESCLIESRKGRPPRFWKCLMKKRK